MRHCRFVPAGVQTWHSRITEYGDERIAYCSTLAIYVIDTTSWETISILSDHKRSISSIAWNPHNRDELLSTTVDGRNVVWNVVTCARVYTCSTKHPVVASDWSTKSNVLYLALQDTSVVRWRLLNASSLGAVSNLFKLITDDGRKNGPPPRNTNIILHSSNDLLAAGAADGKVHIWDPKTKLAKSLSLVNVADHQKSSMLARLTHLGKKEAETSDAPVADLSWDPLSSTYILVSYKGGIVVLWDVEKSTVVQVFDRTSKGTRSVCWVRGVPGVFLTSTQRTGLATIWNVSLSQPTGSIKVAGKGIIRMTASNNIAGNNSGDNNDLKGLVMYSLVGGAIGVHDLAHHKDVFRTEPGHRETIFDVRFAPFNRDVVCTCSYDSHIKIWNIQTMKCLRTLTGQLGIIYAVSWSPYEGTRDPFRCNKSPPATRHANTDQGHKVIKLASCSSLGELWVWDVSKGIPLVKVNHHTKPIYRLEWSTLNPSWIVTSSSDQTVVITDCATGNMVKKYPHPGEVFGCSFDPHRPQRLATGSRGSIVRIFDTTSDANKPQMVLKGHTQRVFNTVWCPLCPNLLASGSDDRTVRVWYLLKDEMQSSLSSAKLDIGFRNHLSSSASKDAEYTSMELKGHTHNVRALVWSPEFYWLLISGSWDGTIRCWDVRSATQLICNRDHHADVYGLDIHPARPFTMVSCSRDTTIRVWDTSSIGSVVRTTMLLRAATPSFPKPPLSFQTSLSGTATCARIVDQGSSLYFPVENVTFEGLGECLASGHAEILCRHIASLPETDLISRFEVIMQYFSTSSHISELFNVLRAFVREGARRRSLRREAVIEHDSDCNSDTIRDDTPTSLFPSNNRSSCSSEESAIEASEADRWYNLISLAKEFTQGSVVIHRSSMVDEAKVVVSELVKAAGKCNGLRTLKMRSRSGVTRTDLLVTAANLTLKCGNIREGCELLVRANHWERAIALAPGCSMEYWKSLSQRYAQHLQENQRVEEATSCYIASDNILKAIETQVTSKSEHGALLIAQACHARQSCTEHGNKICDSDKASIPLMPGGTLLQNDQNSIRSPTFNGHSKGETVPCDNESVLSMEHPECCYTASNVCKSYTSITRSEALKESYAGNGVKAAALFLSINKPRDAICALERCCEYDLAFVVARCTGSNDIETLLIKMADRCEALGATTVAREALFHSRQSSLERLLLCVRITTPNSKAVQPPPNSRTIAQSRRMMHSKGRTATLDEYELVASQAVASLYDSNTTQHHVNPEIAKLRRELGMRETSMYVQDGEENLGKGNLIEAVKMFLLAGGTRHHERAVEIAAEMLDEIFDDVEWDIAKAKEILHIASSSSACGLTSRTRGRLLAYSALVGALLATWKGYDRVVCPLYHAVAAIRHHHKLTYPEDFKVSEAELLKLEATFMYTRACTKHDSNQRQVLLRLAMGKVDAAFNNHENQDPQHEAVDTEAQQTSIMKELQNLKHRISKLQNESLDLKHTPTSEDVPLGHIHREKNVAAPAEGMVPKLEQQETDNRNWKIASQASDTLAIPEPMNNAVDALNHGSLCSKSVPIVLRASMLPSGTVRERQRSVLDGTIIHGPSITLEDGIHAMKYEDAVMWAEVNVFSPQHTGARMSIF